MTFQIDIRLTGSTPSFGVASATPSAVEIGSAVVPTGTDEVQWKISNPDGISGGKTSIAAVVLANADISTTDGPPVVQKGVDAFTYMEQTNGTFLWQEGTWTAPRNPMSIDGTVWVAVAPPTACTLKILATPLEWVFFETWIYFWSEGIGIWYANSPLELEGPGATTVVPPFGNTSAEGDFFDDWAGSRADGGGSRTLGSPRISSVTFYGTNFIEGMKTSFDQGPDIAHGGSSTSPTTLDIADDDYLVYANLDYGPAKGQSAPIIVGVTLLTHQGKRKEFGAVGGGTSSHQIGEAGGSQQILGFSGFTHASTLGSASGIAALGAVLGPRPS